MNKLAGKVAWISGSTSGIGEATARLFAREGAGITLAGRRLDRNSFRQRPDRGTCLFPAAPHDRRVINLSADCAREVTIGDITP